MRVLSEEEKKLFYERGYIVFKEVVSRDQLISFKNTLHKLVDSYCLKYIERCENSRLLSCDEKIIALKNKNPLLISIIQRIISRTAEFYSLSSSEKVISLMRFLYGLDAHHPLYMINNGVVFTCPNDADSDAVSNFETDWHNDVFYTIPESQFCQIWLPLLSDATPEIGTLVVCPGSHNHGIGKQQLNIDSNFNNRYTIDKDSLSHYVPESINVEIGDVLIFDSRLIHKSGNNTSNNVRCTLLGSYHDALHDKFSPVSFEYKYNGKTPEGFFYEIFGDEQAKKMMYDDLAESDLSFNTGV